MSILYAAYEKCEEDQHPQERGSDAQSLVLGFLSFLCMDGEATLLYIIVFGTKCLVSLSQTKHPGCRRVSICVAMLVNAIWNTSLARTIKQYRCFVKQLSSSRLAFVRHIQHLPLRLLNCRPCLQTPLPIRLTRMTRRDTMKTVPSSQKIVRTTEYPSRPLRR